MWRFAKAVGAIVPRAPKGALLVWVPILAALTLVLGCTVQLSPAYDPALYENLSELNVKTETLFAGLSAEGAAPDFASRRETYDDLIGGFAAARLTSAARDIPSLGLRLASSPALKELCGDAPQDCVNTTPHHLEKIVALLDAMRDADRRGGLSRFILEGADGTGGIKNQYETDMQNILIFEAALQR